LTITVSARLTTAKLCQNLKKYAKVTKMCKSNKNVQYFSIASSEVDVTIEQIVGQLELPDRTFGPQVPTTF
jgi:hypothetical protein